MARRPRANQSSALHPEAEEKDKGKKSGEASEKKPRTTHFKKSTEAEGEKPKKEEGELQKLRTMRKVKALRAGKQEKKDRKIISHPSMKQKDRQSPEHEDKNAAVK